MPSITGALFAFSFALADAPQEVDLWPNGVPGAPAQIGAEDVKDTGKPNQPDRHVRNVHKPTLTIYKPTGKSAEAAIIICPGGGYHILALDKEGHDVAKWAAANGYVGVVLKYRLPRPDGHRYPHDAPLADAQQAIRWVRANADSLGVKPNRVGIMGFSAGGHLASTAATHFDAKPQSGPSTRPDFAVLIYPVTTFDPAVGHTGSAKSLLGENPPAELVLRYSNDRHVAQETPPTFLVHTSDDPVKVENSLAFYAALRRSKVPAELHVFAKGGHGYGLRTDWQGEKNPPVSTWPTLLDRWLKRVVLKVE
jgi:acetyl esterase/lipase